MHGSSERHRQVDVHRPWAKPEMEVSVEKLQSGVHGTGYRRWMGRAISPGSGSGYCCLCTWVSAGR